MAGVDRPEDKTRVQGWVNEVLPTKNITIDNDAVAALASGTHGRLFGVVVIRCIYTPVHLACTHMHTHRTDEQLMYKST